MSAKTTSRKPSTAKGKARGQASSQRTPSQQLASSSPTRNIATSATPASSARSRTPSPAARTQRVPHSARSSAVSLAPSAASRQRYRDRSFLSAFPGGKIALVVVGLVLVVTVIVVAIRYFAGLSTGGQYAYTVGHPGPGATAPDIQLPSTTGGGFHLAAQRGKTVLLYFQEGITCEPCWTQLKDIDSHLSSFQGLGINEVVSVTTDPLDTLKQKVADEGISTPVLSDARLSVSNAYATNQYGMMGTSRDGHSFIVVGPTGRILWRADFGGAPNYTMYVPVATLLADLRQGLHTTGK